MARKGYVTPLQREAQAFAVERAKLDLAAGTFEHMQDYADAKTAVVNEILGRAGWAPPEP